MNKGKMKRLLALLLCVTQLIGFVPHVHADEVATPDEATPCTHPEAYLTETTRTKKNETVDDITDTHHTRYFDVYGVYTCNACGETGIEKFIEPGDEEELHNFVNGVCVTKGCGKAQPHEHNYVVTGKEDVVTYKDQTANSHTMVTTTVTTYTCEGCSDSYTESGTPDDYTDMHSYSNGSTTCVCGWACTHAYSTEDTANAVRVESGYAKLSESDSAYSQYHKKLYTKTTKLYCNACGTLTGENTAEEYELVAHSSTDIINTETHTTYSKYNSEQHYKDEEIINTYASCECGYQHVVREFKYNQVEDHNFDGDVCTNCEYSKAHVCDFTTGTPKTVTSYEATEDGTQHKIKVVTTRTCSCGKEEETSNTSYGNAEDHTYEGWPMTCKYCGAVYQTPSVPECDVHTWVNGKCDVCGVTCAHEHTYPDDALENLIDPVFGDATPYTPDQSPVYHLMHRRSYAATANLYCEECGEWAGTRYYDDIGVSEEHYFVNSEVCRNCGYTCQHSYGADNVCEWCKTVKPCDVHTWDEDGWGYCTTCGTNCTHNFVNSNCTVCGYVCSSHYFSNGVCSVCGYEQATEPEECAHEGKVLIEENTYRLAEGSSWATVEGQYQHTARATLGNAYECPVCEEYLFEALDVEQTYTFDCVEDNGEGKCDVCGGELKPTECEHDWDGDECIHCGEVCTHEGKVLIEENTYRLAEGSSWATVEGQYQHTARATLGNAYECPVCEEYPFEALDVEQTYTFDCVEDNGEGKCDVCGGELKPTECQHDSETQVGDAYTKTSYTINEDNTHTVLEEKIKDFKCDACGETSSRTDGSTTRTEKHTYDITGLCACGKQLAICQGEHESVESGTNGWNFSAYVYNNDGTHSYTADTQKVYKCWECGLEWSDPVQVGVKITDRCSVENGACTVCGAVQEACTHPNGEYKGWGYQLENGKAWEHRNDPHYHYGTAYYVETYYCADCQQYYSITSDTAEENAKMAHWYPEGTDTCEECGYVNACTHDRVDSWTEFRLVDGEVWTVSDKEHSGLSKAITHFYCGACHKSWEESSADAQINSEKHNFVDGLCSVCGYENTCSHPEEMMSYWTYFEPVAGEMWKDNGDGTHYANSYIRDSWECDACGEYHSSRRNDTPSVNYEQHHFEDGVCVVCDAENTCEHKHTDSWQRYENTTDRVAVDGINHKYTADVYEIVWCDDCETQLSSTLLGKGMEIVRHHEFVDDVCDSCGYKSLCDHSEIEEIDWYSLIDMGTPVDDKSHTGLFYHSIDKWCKICSAYLGETVIDESVEHTERHSFYEGVCNGCGYVSNCTHENTYTEVTHGMEKNPTYIDEYTHSVTVTEYTDVYCADCEEWLEDKSSEKENVVITENHRLNANGVCVYCGKAGAAPTPAPTATPTPAPTATPTPAPTATPTPEPEEDDDEDYFVPTPRPNTNNNYRPAATAVPTVAPTVEPTVEPTAEPTLAPVKNEMVSTLVESIAAVEAEGTVVTIEIIGAQEVFTEEDHEQLKELPVAEQILVTLSTIGFGDVVEAAMTSMNVTLSEDAAQLVTKANETMSQMPEEERKAMQEAIEKNFPKTQVQINGVVYDYFILNLEVVVDGVARVESYGFRYDEELGQWIFVQMDMLEAEEVA